MFKVIIMLFCAFIINLFSAASANANISNALHNMCTLVIANDPIALREKIQKVKKNYRLKLQHYYSGISCAGNSLIRTALLNNANETGKFLIHKLPRATLLSPEPDGRTLQQWIDEKNLSDTPISLTLTNRI